MPDRSPFPADVQDLGAILEAIPEFVLVMGADGRILYMNRAPPGYGQEDFAGMNGLELMAPASRDAHEEALASVLATGEPVEYDAEVTLPEGEVRWYRSGVHPFAGVEAEEAVLLVSTDITELKAKEEELAQLRRLLPICSWCDKIQNDEGAWESVEAYLGREARTQVSHGVCPDCYERKMGEMDAEDEANGDAA